MTNPQFLSQSQEQLLEGVTQELAMSQATVSTQDHRLRDTTTQLADLRLALDQAQAQLEHEREASQRAAQLASVQDTIIEEVS